MLFESELQRRGLVLSNTVQMASNEAIRVAVLSRHVLPAQEAGFKVLTVTDVSLASHWYFVIRTERHISHAARSFLQFAQYLDTQWCATSY